MVIGRYGNGHGIFWFLQASLLGPSLTPIAGALAARYASWCDLRLSVGFCSAAQFAAVLLVLHGTSWPGARGIDKLREVVTLLP